MIINLDESIDVLFKQLLSEKIKELRRHPLLRVGPIASILMIIIGVFGLYFQYKIILTTEISIKGLNLDVKNLDKENDQFNSLNINLQSRNDDYKEEQGDFRKEISNLQNKIGNQRNKIFQFETVDKVRNELIANNSIEANSQLQNTEKIWEAKFKEENNFRVSLENTLQNTKVKLDEKQKQVETITQEKAALIRNTNNKLNKENYIKFVNSDDALLADFISLRSERYKRSSWRKYRWDLNAHLEYPFVLRDELSKAVTNVYYTLSKNKNTKKMKPWAKHTKQGDKFFPFDINTNTPMQEITAHITFRGKEIKITVSAPEL